MGGAGRVEGALGIDQCAEFLLSGSSGQQRAEKRGAARRSGTGNFSQSASGDLAPGEGQRFKRLFQGGSIEDGRRGYHFRLIFAYTEGARVSMPQNYIELHARSAFSFLRGACTPENYADRCASLDQPGMALLDFDGFYGSPRFHGAMKKQKNPPLYRSGGRLASDGARYPLLVVDRTGYQNLCRMITRMKLRTNKHPKPGQRAAVTPEELEELSEGLLCLTGAADGPLALGLAKGKGRADSGAAAAHIRERTRLLGVTATL